MAAAAIDEPEQSDGPGLKGFAKNAAYAFTGAVGGILDTALVLGGMRNPKVESPIQKMNLGLADQIVGIYLGTKMGAYRPTPVQTSKLLKRISMEKPTDKPSALVKRASGEEKGTTDVQQAEALGELVQQTVENIDPEAAATPCPVVASAAAASAGEPEESETQYYDDYEEYLRDQGLGGGRKSKTRKAKKVVSTRTRKHKKITSKRGGGCGCAMMYGGAWGRAVRAHKVRLPVTAGKRSRRANKGKGKK